MIDINRETGTVTWDGFTLYTHLTHDEFVQRYPTIELRRNVYNIGGIHDRVYQFAKIKLGDYFLTPNAHYENHRLANVSFHVDKLLYNDFLFSPVVSAESIEQLHDTSDKLRKLLITQFGQPHEYARKVDSVPFHPALTADDLQAMQEWWYRFEWGGVNSYFSTNDFSEINLGIVVLYSDFFQINTWENLAAECDTRIRNEQEQNRDVAELLAMRSLIDILSPHFEYLKLRPLFHLGKVMFLGCPVDTRVFLTINPSSIANRYAISRQDKREELYIAEGDNSQLIDTLRLFFEAETL